MHTKNEEPNRGRIPGFLAFEMLVVTNLGGFIDRWDILARLRIITMTGTVVLRVFDYEGFCIRH